MSGQLEYGDSAKGKQLKKKRKRYVQGILIVIGIGIIILQILILTGIIPLLSNHDKTNVTGWSLEGNTMNNREQYVVAGQDAGKTYTKYIFVGDSRYVGMSQCKGDNDVFISKSGIGYSYLEEQISRIKLESDPTSALIIGLGVNDLMRSCELYISKLNELAEELDCQIYYMSVNPVDEDRESLNGYSVKNADIEKFNEKMKTELSSKIIYIDSYAYLKSHAYETVDGLHYNDKTYKLIYDFIKSSL